MLIIKNIIPLLLKRMIEKLGFNFEEIFYEKKLPLYI
jgi:hypothetical protein